METSTDRSLMQRAEYALASLRYREQAALYHAAAKTLQIAMEEAEHGDTSRLDEWLRQNGDLLAVGEFADQSLQRNAVGKTNTLGLNSLGPGVSGIESPIRMEHRFHQSDPAKHLRVDCPTESQSPWDYMERCARKRLESINQTVPSSEEANHESAATRALHDDGDRSTDVGESRDQASVSSISKLDPLLLGKRSDQNQTTWKRIAAPHVWISFLLHLLVVPVLGYIVVAQVHEAKKLSIVSASVESDQVLTETALELPSTLEASDLSDSVAELAEPTLPTDISLPTLEPIGTLSAVASTTSNSITQALKNGNGMPASNKLVMGAEFFGVKATGNTFVYIVDCSPSMKRDGAFEAAKQEISRSLGSMKPTQRFHLLFFGKEIDCLTLEPGKPEDFPIHATPANVQKATEWLGRASIQKEGWPPNDSLSRAIEMQPDGIFMLFDGDTRSDVAKHLSKVNRIQDVLSDPGPKVPIHVVHFFQDEFVSAMRRIAAENAGTYRFVARPERNKSVKK